MKIETVHYHRNGTGGEPFHVVMFTDDNRNMVGIVFDEPGRVAVIDRDLIATTAEFGVNSWRGDHYENELRDAIAEYECA
jgi:hypothetical protein